MIAAATTAVLSLDATVVLLTPVVLATVRALRVPSRPHLYGDRLDELVATADVVLDCCDNFATRHAVNRACVAAATLRSDARWER